MNAFLQNAFIMLMVWLVMVLPVFSQSGEDYELNWSTIDGGGGLCVGGGYMVMGTIGQADTGWSAGDGYQVMAGFFAYPHVPECLSMGAYEYEDWVAWGRPRCWCYARQCRGDADGKPIYPGVGIYVSLTDLNILRAAINKMYDQPGWPADGICADFDHAPIYPGVPIRVSYMDLLILRLYINKMAGQVPLCDEDLVYTGPYNFWTSP